MNLREYRAAASLLAARHKTPESTLKDQVTALLMRMPGVDVVRMNVGQASHGGRKVRYGYPGMADLYVRIGITKCDPCKRTLWMELKAADGRMSDAQIAFMAQAEKWGDRYAVVKSVDDAVKVIEEVRNA